MNVWRQPRNPVADQAPILFLDRDGVVIVDRNYLSDPGEVELVPGVPAALVRARAAGFRLVGVSNQSGLGRGMFGEDDLAAVMTRLDALLAAEGVVFDAFYYCPHAPEDDCPCRKPRPGLLEEAGRVFRWDPATSWVIGDKTDDVGLGRGAGMGAVHVLTGHGAGHRPRVIERWGEDPAVLLAADLPEAIDRILSHLPETGP